MKLISRWLGALFLCASILAQAQTQTTGNVVYSTVNPAPEGASYSWSGFEVTQSTGGGLSGGHVPGYNISTGQFLFGYAPGTIGYSIALNTVLSGTGIQLSGIQYGLQYFNQDFSRGTLSTTVTLQNKQGGTLESYYHALPQTTQGWTNFDQTKTFTNPYQLSNVGNATMSFSGQDDRFWAGYYGPQVRNPYMRFNYGADICGANPLSSPDCPGYAAAYFTQQCTISALFNPACPGYAAAYLTQQCTINPLADPSCPGYQQAYKTQQCSINPLYATDCPGYAVAYKSQQCSINPLYATDCPGYQQAYKTQQCSINPLYATDCPGYAQAYYTQQCTANALYDSGCPGYQAAYAKKNILNIGTTTTTTAATTAVVTESATSTAKTDPISIATTSTTTSTTSPTSVTSVTSVVSGGSANATTAVVTSTQSTAQSSTTTTTTTAAPTSTETRKTDTEIKSVASTSSSRDDMKGRVEARAKEIARAGAEAKSFEAQTAVQGTVVALMGFVPGFDAYGTARIIDINGQQMSRLYGRGNVDNRSALRGLTGASDRLHSDMVDQQYQLGK